MLIPPRAFKKGPGRNAERFLYSSKPALLATLPRFEVYPLHHLIPLEQGVK